MFLRYLCPPPGARRAGIRLCSRVLARCAGFGGAAVREDTSISHVRAVAVPMVSAKSVAPGHQMLHPAVADPRPPSTPSASGMSLTSGEWSAAQPPMSPEARGERSRSAIGNRRPASSCTRGLRHRPPPTT